MSTTITRPRCFPNPGHILPFNPTVEIPRHLEILITTYPPKPETFFGDDGTAPNELTFSGLFSGPTSIAYFFYLISLPTCRYASIPIGGEIPIVWAKRYLAISKELVEKYPASVPPVESRNCAIVNEICCFATVSALVYQSEEHVKELVGYLPTVSSDDPVGEDEPVYGRAGYLFLLRTISTYTPSLAHLIPSSAVPSIISVILKRPMKEWRFVERPYIGIGHGWFGILVQIILSDPTYTKQLRPDVMRIIHEQRDDDGNWNKFANEGDEVSSYQMDELIQIGHGAPGMVVGLLAIRPIYAQQNDQEMVSRIDTAIEKAQNVIWERGLLTKESCLQHGAAGNSLALFDIGRKGTFLAKSVREECVSGVADGSLDPSSSPSGLHRGLAGTIWGMMEMERGRNGVFPSFDDV